jgi:hypothetical protein
MSQNFAQPNTSNNPYEMIGRDDRPARMHARDERQVEGEFSTAAAAVSHA